MRPASLLITDGGTITLAKLSESKFKASSNAWEDDATIAADQVLEIRIRDAQLHPIQRDKIMEPEGAPPTIGSNDVAKNDIADL